MREREGERADAFEEREFWMTFAGKRAFKTQTGTRVDSKNLERKSEKGRERRGTVVVCEREGEKERVGAVVVRQRERERKKEREREREVEEKRES